MGPLFEIGMQRGDRALEIMAEVKGVGGLEMGAGPVDGREMRSDWIYCPWHGLRLTD